MEEEITFELPKNMSIDYLYTVYLIHNPDGTKEEFSAIMDALIAGGILRED